MKRIIFSLFLFSISLISCNKDESPVIVPSNSCSSVSNFTVAQQNENLLLTISTSSNPLYYELSFQQASSSPNPERGNSFIINSLSNTIPFSKLTGFNGTGTYVFYIRAICSSSNNSDWSEAKILTITDYCNTPSNISYNGSYLTWDSSYNNTNYQVQYGVHGFSLGKGSISSTSNTYQTGFVMNYNTSYDFYVRSFCSSSNTWSSWKGPYTYLNTQNACNLPTNLSRQIESTTSTTAWVSLHWSYNGGSNFEFMVVSHGASTTNATIYSASTSGWPVISLNRSFTYDFYMRTICSDGSRTAWTTPYLISNL